MDTISKKVNKYFDEWYKKNVAPKQVLTFDKVENRKTPNNFFQKRKIVDGLMCDTDKAKYIGTFPGCAGQESFFVTEKNRYFLVRGNMFSFTTEDYIKDRMMRFDPDMYEKYFEVEEA